MDNFDGLALSSGSLEKLKFSSSSSSSLSLTYVSPLLERTVIILPSFFFARPRDGPSVASFIHVLDFLCQSKFDICGMKTVLLSPDSAQELQVILSLEIEVGDIIL